MTREEKLTFIGTLIQNVLDSVLAKVADMPEEWDGFELRRYIADKFEDAAYVKMPPKRARDYRNTLIVTNL